MLCGAHYDEPDHRVGEALGGKLSAVSCASMPVRAPIAEMSFRQNTIMPNTPVMKSIQNLGVRHNPIK